jgi:Family of unknown function (DUF6328)
VQRCGSLLLLHDPKSKMSAHRKVKTALDETRLLILGAQILLGFHLNGAFQAGFADLSNVARAFHAAAFFAMAAAVGLLITPSLEHLIVERGRSTARILRLTTCFAGLALLPMGLSLGVDLSIVLSYRFGTTVGLTVGMVTSVLAFVLWYGTEFLLRKPNKGEQVMDERTSIDIRVEHMLTEARVLLPGAQALFGFQMAVLLTQTFDALPSSSKVIHAVALCCIAIAIILLMAPAAFHRITFHGKNTESFHRIGSRFVIASAVPLAAGITADLYVAVTKALYSAVAGAILAAATAALLITLWFVRPLIHRNSIDKAGHG